MYLWLSSPWWFVLAAVWLLTGCFVCDKRTAMLDWSLLVLMLGPQTSTHNLKPGTLCLYSWNAAMGAFLSPVWRALRQGTCNFCQKICPLILVSCIFKGKLEHYQSLRSCTCDPDLEGGIALPHELVGRKSATKFGWTLKSWDPLASWPSSSKFAQQLDLNAPL